MNDAPLFVGSLNYMGEAETREIPISDGRRLPDSWSWQANGFELLSHVSTVSDWDDDAEVSGVNYPEMAAFAKALTGATHALVSGHIARNPEQAKVHSDLGPISFVHSDFAENYGQLIRSLYTAEQQPATDTEDARRHAETLAAAGLDRTAFDAAKRIVILQFWRNVGPRRMDLPLALCDAQSVAGDEVVAIPVNDYAGGGFDFDALGVHAPDRPDQHRWFTFPDLGDDEVVAIRTFDSDMAADGGHFWTPHTAVRDPAVALGSPARRSIELRATCLFH